VWASNLAYFGFVRLTHISNNVLTIAVGAINAKYASPILGGTGCTFAGMDLVLYSFAREFPCLRSRPFPSPATLRKLFSAFFFQHRLPAGRRDMDAMLPGTDVPQSSQADTSRSAGASACQAFLCLDL
jgi:hypothetical protein